MMRGTRASYDANGEKLFGCDVCWTCELFNHNDWICSDGSNIILKIEPKLIVTNCIEKPGHTSCPYWKDKGEQNAN